MVQTWKVGTPPPPLPALQLSDRNIEVKLGEAQQIELGTSLLRRITPVTVGVHVQRQAGYDFSKVRTSTESALPQAAAQLNIDWNVKPPIVVSPSRIVIHTGDAERIVRVESSDGQPIPIVAARCDHPAIAVRKSPAESNAVLVNCKLPLNAFTPPLAEIVIDTGGDRNSRVTVAVVFAGANGASK